eukprot:gene41000-55411_t
MARGETHYTVLDGTAELKAAIQHKFRHDNGLDFQLNEITAGAGAKQILYNALMASVNPGDEVILPAPSQAPADEEHDPSPCLAAGLGLWPDAPGSQALNESRGCSTLSPTRAYAESAALMSAASGAIGIGAG